MCDCVFECVCDRVRSCVCARARVLVCVCVCLQTIDAGPSEQHSTEHDDVPIGRRVHAREAPLHSLADDHTAQHAPVRPVKRGQRGRRRRERRRRTPGSCGKVRAHSSFGRSRWRIGWLLTCALLQLGPLSRPG